MDFTPSAGDYARHRAGFPDSFFERVAIAGRILDLGSGTGSLARGFLRRGARVVALDVSHAMLATAPDLQARVVASAERCPFGDGVFDAVVAGQCWHWFDGPRTAVEARRVLTPGGRLVIAHFDYLVRESEIASVTEALILELNPTWRFAGSDGTYERWRPHLAGYTEVTSFSYDEQILYSHEAWRGRMRACNGVIALGSQIATFDAELARRLEPYPDPIRVPHRVFVILARA